LAENWIYSEFDPEILWIRNAVSEDALKLPSPYERFLDYYLNDRLKILTNPLPREAKLGRIFPYAVFWLAIALPNKDIGNVRKLALSGVYDCLSVTIEDDLIDCHLEAGRERLTALGDNYAKARNKLRRELFGPNSRFWDILSDCNTEHALYKKWNSSYNEWADPLSDTYLRNSSRYVVSVLLPSLGGVATLAKSEDKIDGISQFLETFSMAWRIVDDIWDWQEDLQVRNLNNSTILHLIKSELKAEKISEEDVLAAFLDDKLVQTIYQRVVELLKSAKESSHEIICPYLEQFMENQIDYYASQCDSLLGLNKSFQKDLTSLMPAIYL
jgi:hypothetical protein